MTRLPVYRVQIPGAIQAGIRGEVRFGLLEGTEGWLGGALRGVCVVLVLYLLHASADDAGRGRHVFQLGQLFHCLGYVYACVGWNDG